MSRTRKYLAIALLTVGALYGCTKTQEPVEGSAAGATPATAPVTAAAAASPTAIVAGDPTVKTMAGSATVGGQTLKIGDTVPWGTAVEVSKDGLLEIASGNQVAVRAWGPSRFTMTRQGSEAWVRIAAGRLIAAFMPGSKGGLNLPTSVAGVRGTVVYGEIVNEKDDYICVCEGTVALGHAKGASEAVSATHHDHPKLTTESGFKEAGMLNHVDDDVAAVKKLIGR